MTIANGYATTPGISGTADPVSSTGAAEYTSLELYDNSEVDIIDISKYGGGSPFLTMLTKFGRSRNGGKFNELGLTERTVNNFPEIRYKEQDSESQTYTVNAIAAAGTAGANMTIVFTSTVGLLPSMTLRIVRTNEQIRIVSVDSATNVTATRMVGTVTNQALAVNDVAFVLGTSVASGTASIGDVGSSAADRVNYIQKFVESVEIKDFQMMSAKVGGSKSAIIDRRMKQAAVNMSMQIERAALFGQKFSGVDGSGNPYYTTEGLVECAKRGWSDDISGSLTLRTLEEGLAQPMRYLSPNNTTKFLLCGSRVRPAISALVQSQINKEDVLDSSTRVETLTIGNGKYIFIDSPMLDETSGFEKHAIVVDPAFFTVCYPTGEGFDGKFDGKTRFEYNQADSTYANQKGDYVAYVGFQNANANSTALLKIVT